MFIVFDQPSDRIINVNTGMVASEDQGSRNGLITSDGQHVVFEQLDNGVPYASYFALDSMISRRIVESTVDGNAINSPVLLVGLSDTGRALILTSVARIVESDVDSLNDAFIYDVASDELKCVSLLANDQQLLRNVLHARISRNGRYVAFATEEPGGASRLYLRDTINGSTYDVTNNTLDGNPLNNTLSIDGVSDGGDVLVLTQASNVLLGDSNGVQDYYLFVNSTRQFLLVSRGHGWTKFCIMQARQEFFRAMEVM